MYLCIGVAVVGGIFYIWCLKQKKQQTHGIYALVLIATGVLAAAAASGEQKEPSEGASELEIERPEPGNSSILEDYELQVEELAIEEPYSVVVENRHLTQSELEELFDAAAGELEEEFLGENESLERITHSLGLVDSVCEGQVSVSWSFDPYGVIDLNGNLIREEIDAGGTIVCVKAELSYEEQTAEHSFSCKVYPPKQTKTEIFFEQLTKALARENASTSSIFSLPTQVGGYTINWELRRNQTPYQILMLGIAALIGIMIGKKEDEKKKIAQRKERLLLQYPKMLGQLSLLISAGMTVSYAWERMVTSYEKQLANGSVSAGEQPIYEEMRITYRQMKDGIGERAAYEQFGERLQLSVYRRFSTLLVQNLRKGTAGLSKLLEKEMQDAYDAQESNLKKRGEELQTKLLLPMMLMLGLVVVIIMIPALASFQF